ncbi:MAG: hypothetical protein M3123_03065, partial [Actinomycetota bacterium]|nr:hypothetical protein [Actinomycetota bacterium]
TGLEPLSATAPLETPAPAPEEGGLSWAAPSERDDETPPQRTSRWPRRFVGAMIALALVAILLLVALWGLANTHFVGAEDDGRVAVYQGLPYDVGGGVSLYRARYVSRLRAAQLSQGERAALFDHELTSYDGARERIAGYEAEATP